MKNYKALSLIILLSYIPYLLSVEESPYFVKMKDVQLKSLSFSELNISSQAVFFNTYNAKAKLTEVTVDIYVENKFIGTVTQVEDVDIPKKSAFDIPINIAAKTSSSLGSLLWQSGRMVFGKTVEIKFEGYIKIKALGFVPLKVPISSTEYYNLKDIL
jgi:hypothetical protein